MESKTCVAHIATNGAVIGITAVAKDDGLKAKTCRGDSAAHTDQTLARDVDLC